MGVRSTTKMFIFSIAMQYFTWRPANQHEVTVSFEDLGELNL
jgi:hypothetical protein